MSKGRTSIMREITALKVSQWLADWDHIPFNAKDHKAKPLPHFYLFCLSASQLRALSGIYRRRRTAKSSAKLLGIQRRHDKERSSEIARFIQYGFPWSVLSVAKRSSGEYDDLRKPGWLPTAIVVNILRKNDERNRRKVDSSDLISVKDKGGGTSIINLPQKYKASDWKPGGLPPLEVIDGQHRLWAFDEGAIDEDYQLPVVAFHGLDISWQAYLFWSINIKPKKINASLAFDLYPLLRTEEWLDKFEGHPIYRETRSQELVETLWSHPESPWYQRINMLGESGYRQIMVSQAAWIRSLMATFVKSWEGRRSRGLGGLFGAPVGSHSQVLPWSRAQQAAFLIFLGLKLEGAIKKSKVRWAIELRRSASEDEELFEEERDAAFYGPNNLLNTDQGIRVFLHVANDLLYLRVRELRLEDWVLDDGKADDLESSVSAALKSLKGTKISKFITELSQILSRYDWRSSSAEGLSEEERLQKAAYRGSGGYKELRLQLIQHVAKGAGEVSKAAKELKDIVG